MDVLSIDLVRVAPYGAPEPGRPAGRARSLGAWFARLLDLRPGGAGDPPGSPARAQTDAASRRALFLGYTTAEIILGLGLLVFVTVAVPVAPGIASEALAGTVLGGATGGVLLWTMFGLLGSVRSISATGSNAHFTFHTPFVGAATILGGPAAGAWVAFLSTIDRREVETQPWWGVLANHAAMTTAAVAAGASYAVVDSTLAGLTGDRNLARFAAIITSGLILALVANAFALGTVKFRDELSWAGVLGILVDDFRRETVLEIALVWVLVIASSVVGWWAPLVVGLGVIWYAGHERSGEGPDPLSGTPRKAEFLRRTDGKIGWIRRGILGGGAMLYLDLNGFHVVNNAHGHEVGDVALRVVAERIRAVVTRREDLVSRLMGDEFGIFLVGVTAPHVALRKAEQLLDAISKPIPTPVGPVNVGVAVGVVVVDGSTTTPPSAMRLLLRSEQAMYLAKRSSGPQGGVHLWADGDERPFSVDWLEAQR